MSEGCHVSPYSGHWYPGEPGPLRELLAGTEAESLQRTGPFLLPGPLGFVVPHAGISYSGTVAWSVYRALRAAAPRRVILLGFSHRGTAGGLSLPGIACYRTPLGDLPLDREIMAHLATSGVFRRVRETIICDHSTEIQLPFLQSALPGVPLVPISAGRADPAELDNAARVLAPLVRDGSLLVASSDFTHYGAAFRYRPFPPDETIGERLRELDDDLAGAAGSLDVRIFDAAVRHHQATLCGVDPISLLIATLRRIEDGGAAIYQQTLDYQTSGEKTGDYQHSVSYRALGYYPASSFALSPEAGLALAEMALYTLRRAAGAGPAGHPPPGTAPSAELQARLPVFVTLYAGGSLRGCIGSCFQPGPLAASIPELTLAAWNDDRFPAVRAHELESTEVQISLLTPFRRIHSRDQWQPGVHGAMLRCGECRGILLPQVAAERNWDQGEFFGALARKAGCPPGVYSQPECRLFVFQSHTWRRRYTDVEWIF